jgi:hypothetical protein
LVTASTPSLVATSLKIMLGLGKLTNK